jgi:hypothetical protein
MKFTIEITDKAKLAGISAAREAYNAALPVAMTEEKRDEKGSVLEPSVAVEPRPGVLDADEVYLQVVMDSAAASYAKQYMTDPTEIDSKIAELQTMRAKMA